MNYLMCNVPGTLAMQWLPLHQAIVFQAQRLDILRVNPYASSLACWFLVHLSQESGSVDPDQPFY